jgi:hypothetical protein
MNNIPGTVLRVAPQLSIGDAETLAAWFLHKAGPELRAALMADQPQVYARVYPGVDPAAILRNVAAGIAAVQQEQASAFAAKADEYIERAGHYHDPAGRYDYCDDPRCPRNREPARDDDDDDQVSLRTALENARLLTEPDEVNTEYVRGQVNLISDAFGLGRDGASDDAYEIITSAITHKITVDAALSELTALTGIRIEGRNDDTR